MYQYIITTDATIYAVGVVQRFSVTAKAAIVGRPSM
jgi:hypothetical protein